MEMRGFGGEEKKIDCVGTLNSTKLGFVVRHKRVSTTAANS